MSAGVYEAAAVFTLESGETVEVPLSFTVLAAEEESAPGEASGADTEDLPEDVPEAEAEDVPGTESENAPEAEAGI